MSTPLYRKISDLLEAMRIDLATPLALSDEPTLAREYSVSRETVRRALLHLEQLGAVTRKRGVGTFLQPLRPRGDGLRGKHVGVAPPPWLSGQPDSRYASAIYDGIGRWADANDCMFTILPSFAKTMDEHTWLKHLYRRKLSGIVWVQPQERQLGLIHKTAKLFPSIVLGRDVPEKNMHCVTPDYDKAAELIDRHFIQSGCFSYALIGKNILDPFSQQWLESFSKAQKKRGETFRHISHFVDYISFGDANLSRLLQEFYLPLHRNVKGLMFLSSGYLHWTMNDKPFWDRIGRDLSIITMDYSHYPIESFYPGRTITHISCDWGKIAYKAMETLALIAADHEACTVIREDVKLIKGDTVHSVL